MLLMQRRLQKMLNLLEKPQLLQVMLQPLQMQVRKGRIDRCDALMIFETEIL